MNWLRKKIEHFDWTYLAIIYFITIAGIFNIYSATYNLPLSKYVTAQIVWVAISSVVMIIVAFIDYRLWQRFAFSVYALSCGLLLGVLLIGRVSQGAKRWINLGAFSFQPSEIAKVAIVIGLAHYLSKRREDRPRNVIELIGPLVFVGIPFLMILKQPDLGTSLVFLITSLVMILFMGVNKKIIIVACLAIAASAPVLWNGVLRPYQKDRVISFLNPEKYPLSKGYQVIQSKIAIGSGEILGKGYLKGSQSKLQFLPKQHTDFVYSNFAEEFGFLGSIILLGAYFLMGVFGFKIAREARDLFGMLLALGCTVLLLSQSVINFGMEMGLLPVVGMTLPLFSYGGSSLLTTFVAVGLILNVSMKRYIF